MLPLPLRNWLFDHWVQPNKTLKRAPLLLPVDMVFLPKLGMTVFCRFLGNLYRYQKNLSTPLPFGMVQFYPRSGYLLYYFFLFTWAEYCQCLPNLLTFPQPALIPEAFMRYIVEIDRHIDTPSGFQLLSNNPDTIRSHPHLLCFRQQFFHVLEQSSLPIGAKPIILQELADFEKACLQATRQSSAKPIQSLDAILAGKEKTVGMLFATWVRLLNLVYDVAPEYGQAAQQIFWNTGMALQMLDDTLDVPVDIENKTSNVFVCLARESNQEWLELDGYLRYLRTTPWKHLDTVWASQHTSGTLSRIRELGKGYLSGLGKYAPATTELAWVMDRMWIHAVGI